MRLILLLFLLPAILFLLSSCKKYDPADAAFFIKPGLVSLAVTQGQGSSSSGITDLWLYVNGQFQGAYPVENAMPIVTKGEPCRINVFAGIKKNGISNTRIFYNLYNQLQIDTVVENGKTITRPFTFQYLPGVTFTWTENFDTQNQGFTLKKSAYSDTNATIKLAPPEDCFENNSIELGLPSSAPVGAFADFISSGSGFTLPTVSDDIFLELNYKGNNELEVGLVGDGDTYKSILNVNPADTWHKIYIHLGDMAKTPPVSTKYKIFFRLNKSATGPAAPKMFLDNIKLLYIQ